jgi:DNA-binding transcriptional ArsR family regulator
MKKIEKILKALANGRRLAITKYLKNYKEASVGEIAEAINLSFKATSKHLRILAAADLVDKEQKRFRIFYRLADGQHPIVQKIISFL